MPQVLNIYKLGLKKGTAKSRTIRDLLQEYGSTSEGDFPKPPFTYIGRGSDYGNRFKIGKDGSREEVLEKFKEALKRSPNILLSVVSNLPGRDLICFCAPNRCHGDLLLQIANAPDFEIPGFGIPRKIIEEAGFTYPGSMMGTGAAYADL